MDRKRTLLSWSTGKDAAWSLHVLRQAGDYEVVGLLSTVDAASGRVAMHGVRQEVLERQAEAAGLPLLKVAVDWPCSNAAYEAAWSAALQVARARHRATHVAFGDLFLEEIRAYREAQLKETGLQPVFPLWGRPTPALAAEMISGGLRAVLTCVDPRRLPASFAGRAFDRALLDDLPSDVDPCGEGGEFHTCVTAGPMFAAPVPIRVGETVDRDGFLLTDVTCAADSPAERPPAIAPVPRGPEVIPRGAAFATFGADGALTREFLLDRGTCCGNGCRNCPYNWAAVPEERRT